MSLRRRRAIFWTLLTGFAAIIALNGKEAAIAMAFAAVAVAGFYFVFRSARTRDFIIRHALALKIAGFSAPVVVAALFVAVAMRFPWILRPVYDQITIGLVLAAVVLGIVAGILARTIPDYERNLAAAKASPRPAPRKVAGLVALGWEAWRAPLEHPAIFAMTALPWIAGAGAVVWLGAQYQKIVPLFVFVLLIAAFVAVAMFLLAWLRFALAGRVPYGPFVLPGRQFWRVLRFVWLLLIVMAVVSGMVAGGGIKLAGLLQVDKVTGVIPGIKIAALVLGLMGASTLLLLPASLAADESPFDMQRSAVLLRGNWWRFVGGLACAVLPWVLAIAAASRFMPRAAPHVAVLAVLALLVFALLAAFAAYTARAYRLLCPATPS
jgi:hypothetical protein